MVSVETAIKLIKKGEVVAYPTETAFGLGALALNKNAVEKVYSLKKRSKNKKLPIIVSSLKEVEGVNGLGVFLSQTFHPGPLNIALKHKLSWFGAFRISSNPIASKLAKKCGPITATSANLSGEETLFSSKQVKKYFNIPVIDAELKKGKTSTVYDPFKRKIIREGAIPHKEIQAVEIAFDALQKVKPTEKELKEIEARVRNIEKTIQEHHKKFVFGGSVAKGTAIKPIKDLDFFLLFRKGNLEDKLDLLKKIASKLGKPEVEYAQHPYVKTKYKGIVVELVPAYDSKEVKSAADRSKWHVKWVSNLSPQLKEQIMTFKQFCRGIGVYGADLRVEGLSAYAMEVLVSKEKSFLKLLKSIKSWKWPLFEADPVDNTRNVLASLSKEKFNILKEAASEFLENPSSKFFFPKKRIIPPRFTGLYLIELEKPEMPEDAVWGWAKRQARKIKNTTKHTIQKWSVFVDKHVLILIKVSQEKERIIQGPPKEMEEHVKAFKTAHKNTWEKDGQVYAKEKLPSFNGTLLEEKYADLSRSEKQWVSDFFYKPWEY